MNDTSSAVSTFAGLAFSSAYIITMIIVVIISVAGMWKVFEKAGEEGWYSIIPIYNYIVLLRIIGKPWWWMFLSLIPIVNFIVVIYIYLELARVFGKGVGFGIGLIFLTVIFMLILGFGDAEYEGSSNLTSTSW